MPRTLAALALLPALLCASPALARSKGKKVKRCVDVTGQVLEGVSSPRVCKQMGGRWRSVKLRPK